MATASTRYTIMAVNLLQALNLLTMALNLL